MYSVLKVTISMYIAKGLTCRAERGSRESGQGGSASAVITTIKELAYPKGWEV